MMTRFGHPLSPMTRIGQPVRPMTHTELRSRSTNRYPYEAGASPVLAVVFSILAFLLGVLALV